MSQKRHASPFNGYSASAEDTHLKRRQTRNTMAGVHLNVCQKCFCVNEHIRIGPFLFTSKYVRFVCEIRLCKQGPGVILFLFIALHCCNIQKEGSINCTQLCSLKTQERNDN